jgi:hypothetical protein
MIGDFQTSLGIILFLKCWAANNNIKPKSKGSVGMKSPKLFVYASILTDSGVQNAIIRKAVSEWKIAIKTAIKPTGKTTKK